MSTGIIIAIIFGVALLGVFALAFGSGGGVVQYDYHDSLTSGKGLLGGLIGGIL